MLQALPDPVFVVTSNVLANLDGDDALTNLWFLFTKCKGAVDRGHRMENLSWRLWHRELISQTYRPPTPDSPADGTDVSPFDARRPARGQGRYQQAGSPTHRSPIGQVITDITATCISLKRPTLPKLEPKPTILVSDSRPPQTPTAPSVAGSGPTPRVVVVNPTPNLTPHPTPPASPVLPPATTLHNIKAATSQASSRPHLLAPATGSSTCKFYMGSPSSSTSSSSSDSSSSSGEAPVAGSPPATSSTSSTTPPPALTPRTVLSKPAPPAPAPKRHTAAPPPARPTRGASTKNRERLDAEDRELERQAQLAAPLRRTNPSNERLIQYQFHLEERQKQEQEAEERRAAIQEREYKARLEHLERERDRLARANLERTSELRRAVSTSQLNVQDMAVFDFPEEQHLDAQPTLQSSGSHPDLAHAFFGLTRALSPPKALTSNTATRPKSRDPGLIQSSTNLQDLAKQRAAMRAQNHLRGAFTPMVAKAPSETSSTRSSSRPPARDKPVALPLPPPPPPPPPPVAKPKDKTTNAHHPSGRTILVEGDSGDESASDEDDNWTSADEEEAAKTLPPPAAPRPKARSASPVRPAPKNRNRSRRQLPPDMQKHLEMKDVTQAFEEAERQSEAFTFEKLPQRSYSNLSRTNSGLLSQLMNPETVAPQPYRRGHSSGDLRSPTMPLFSKHKAAAVPVAATVNVGSIRDGDAIKTAVEKTAGSSLKSTQSRLSQQSQRSKGRPADHEMETDTEDEGEVNHLNMSNSVAQQKLAEIFGNMHGGGKPQGVQAVRPYGFNHDAVPRRPTTLAKASTTTAMPPPAAPPLERTVTEPLFPYNLPIAAMPVSPRTTRQLMLRNEMSESVRANLIWQRKQDKPAVLPRRNKSFASISSIPSVVRITEKKTQNDHEANERALEDEREEARVEIRRQNLQRNKSWAADR